MFILEVTQAFHDNQVPYVVVGGYALAFHNIVRATVDVDLIIRLKIEDFEKCEMVLNKLGLTSRIPVKAKDIFKFRKEYIENRNLIAWSFVDYKNPSRAVDILINHDLKEIRIKKISLHGHKINVASLEDLLLLKEEANRPQDQIDIVKIKEKLNEKKNS